jgi:FkbM family methyltransferase
MFEANHPVKSPKYATLPNGLEIAYDSQANLDILRREIFDDRVYHDHGIHLKNGDCIVDVGANIGMFVLLLNQILTDARVLAIEPIPATFRLLEINSQLHNRLRLSLFNCGLSSVAGETEFEHYPLTSVASSMFPSNSKEFRRNSRKFILQEIRSRGTFLAWFADNFPEWAWFPLTEMIRRIYQRREKVRCRLDTLSGIIEREQLERIDLLKIDTEGAEHAILSGIEPLHWPRIQQVIIEVHDGMPGLQSVLTILQSHGLDTTHRQLLPKVDHLYVVYGLRTTSKPENNDSSFGHPAMGSPCEDPRKH